MIEDEKITLAQARGIAGITQKTLAQLSGVSLPTIKRIESFDMLNENNDTHIITTRIAYMLLTAINEILKRKGLDIIRIKQFNWHVGYKDNLTYSQLAYHDRERKYEKKKEKKQNGNKK